ncbi:MAG: hypothetical protein RLZZ175_450 [Bacteroidota bacterium]|jgi:F-type H+-transporting ATPase subunit b
MNLITPALGLIFWTSLTFIGLLLILSKFAWKPILAALKERESSIENALKAAEAAKLQMSQLQAENEKLLAEARAERDSILKAANAASVQIIEEAKVKAEKEGSKLLESAKAAINTEKKAALTEIKSLAGSISVEIAEKLIKRELKDQAAQDEFVKSCIKELNLN